MPVLTCCDCGERIDSTEALKSHICLKHLVWIPFECVHCSAVKRCTREATEHDMIRHLNNTHLGQQLKYVYFPDFQKQHVLTEKMQLSENSSMLVQNNPTFQPPIASVVAANQLKPETPISSLQTLAQPVATETRPGSSPVEGSRVKSEQFDDDDFVPFSSERQQPVVKTGKRKTYTEKLNGRCLGCKRHFCDLRKHLESHLSAPVFKCSHCTYSATGKMNVGKHVRKACDPEARVTRIRSTEDVIQELDQLKRTHLGWDWRYTCTECKTGVNSIEWHIFKHHLKAFAYGCPVCGSGHYLNAAVLGHMREKHPGVNARPISYCKEYKKRFYEIKEAIIVRNG